ERSDWQPLERKKVNEELGKVYKIHTLAGNPVKEILLKLNLPDNRILKDGGEGTCFQLSLRFIAAYSYPANNYKDIMKAQVDPHGFAESGSSLLENLAWKVRIIDVKLVGKDCVDNVHEFTGNGGTDLAKITKKWPKLDKIKLEI
nr:hypothetical protein [Tanacetum cinerariifolium]